MSGVNGYNFVPSTKAASSEVNQNFAWFRGHYLPITQSGTWATVADTYDLGSSGRKWRDVYVSGSITTKDMTFSGSLSGIIPLSTSILTSTSSENAGVLSITSVSSTLTTINLGSVTAGQLIYVEGYAACDKGASAGRNRITIDRSSGTGNVVFGYNSPSVISDTYGGAGTQVIPRVVGIGLVSSTGTLVLELLGGSVGSDSTIPTGAAEINSIVFR